MKADPRFFMNQYVSWQVANKDNAALNGKLIAHISGWDLDLWQLASWYREG